MPNFVDPFKISSDLINQYNQDGAICLRQVFDGKWIDKIARGIAKNVASPSSYSEKLKADNDEGSYFNDYFNWRRIEEFEDVVLHSPAAAIAGQLMESTKSIFYHEHVLTKEIGAGKRTPWHHDQSYYPVDGEDICSLWIPVDEVGLESTVRFVRGSHGWGKWFRPVKFATENQYEVVGGGGVASGDSSDNRVYHDVPVSAIESGAWPLLSWSCSPGDCIAFHGKTLHGAPGNVSRENSRRVLSLRWVGDAAVVARRPWVVSPPEIGGLPPGARFAGAAETELPAREMFPVVWRR